MSLHFHSESLPGLNEDEQSEGEEGGDLLKNSKSKTKQAMDRARRMRRKRVTSHKIAFKDLEAMSPADLPPENCALYHVDRASYLKIYSIQMEQMSQTLILSKLKAGESVELKGTKGGGFITKIKLRFVELFCRERAINFGGQPETVVDYYASFDVVDVLSWQRFKPGMATRLQFDNQGWSDAEDHVLINNMLLEKKYTAKLIKIPEHKSLKHMANIMDRTTDDIRSRLRYLDRFDGQLPPKVLTEQLILSKSLWIKLWWRAWSDPALPQIGLRGLIWPWMRRLFATKRGVERDVDDFLRAYIAMLKRKCNMRDLEHSRIVFGKENITIDEFAYRMQLFLYTTGRRKLAYLHQTYSNPWYIKV